MFLFVFARIGKEDVACRCADATWILRAVGRRTEESRWSRIGSRVLTDQIGDHHPALFLLLVTLVFAHVRISALTFRSPWVI
jgi:hypothetical protein